MKTLKVTLEIKVDDWTPDFEEDDDPPCLAADYKASDVADVFTNIDEHNTSEILAGSDVMVNFKECRVVEAAWLD